jgi:isopentenyl-diphosphate delta-isomerase
MTRGDVVSSESEELILVDDQDRETGFGSKADCHDGEGLLHRAFSVFLFNGQGEVLLQQRAAGKRLWPMFWSNSCCSHPRRGESIEDAAVRRLEQELGVRAELRYLYKFMYHARFGQAGSERELCSVFVGRSDDAVVANGTEVNACRWMTPGALDADLERNPGRYTPWFKLEWPRVRDRAPSPEPTRRVVNT